MYFIGMDIGTTGAKTMVFDKKGYPLSSVSQEYRSYYPNPNWVEIKGEEMLEAAFFTCRKAIEESGLKPEEILSFSISTQRSSFGFLDEKGNLINDIFYSWQDNRATDSLDYMRERVPEEISASLSGLPVMPVYAISKLIWIKRHQNELYKKAQKIVLMPDYIMKLLGANDYYCDHGNAAVFGMLDIKNGVWSKELFDAYDLEIGLMPEIIDSTKQIGIISSEGSTLSGMAVGTPLVMGSGDQQCGVIGAGSVRQGMASLTVGTAAFLISFLDKPVLDYKVSKGMMSMCAGIPGKYEIEGAMLGAAGNYKWFRDSFCEMEIEEGKKTGQDPYVIMEEYVKKTPLGSNGIMTLPHLGSAGCPHWNIEASGVIAGMTFAHSKADVARSFMEGIIFEIRNIYEAMKEAGVLSEEIIVTGGATKSPTWRQIMADILNCRIKTLVVNDATVLGAAILGAVGIGCFDSVESCVAEMVHYKDDVLPISDNVGRYNALYIKYCKFYDALVSQDIFRELYLVNKGVF